MTNIKPELPGGFRDYLPEQESIRQEMIKKIVYVFERFGFVPTDTPGVEKRDILTGGDSSFDKELLNLEKDSLSLRFDLTVPLARMISANSGDIQKPFRRYQIGKVWRGEKPQKGRYREFMQCDVDIVGTKNVLAEAEIIAVIYSVLTYLGIKDFIVKINNRKILNGLVESLNAANETKDSIFRILDKLNKIGWESVAAEFEQLGLDDNDINSIKEYISLSEDMKANSGKESIKILETVEKKFSNDEAEEGVREIREVLEYLENLGIPEDKWQIDTSIVRGLGYYTGTIFETVLINSDIGSIFSGGRFDGLIERFSGSEIPAVGASLGFDRLFAAMEEMGLNGDYESNTSVMVLNFEPTCEDMVLGLTSKLREEGIATDIYVGNDDSLKGQLSHATRMRIPIVCILGSKEKEKGVVQVKNMKKEEQQEVSLDGVVDYINDLI